MAQSMYYGGHPVLLLSTEAPIMMLIGADVFL